MSVTKYTANTFLTFRGYL